MKFKLIKDKEFFQIVCDQKSVKEIIDGENKSYEIEWYASTKDKDRMNDVVEPTAFEETLKQYMTNPIVLLQHDMDKPIGNVIEASIDDKGLFIKAKITEDTDWVFSKLKNGVLRTFSIWYSVKDYETIENVDAEWKYSYTNIIKALELFEISLVSVPANPFALVKSFDSCFKSEEEVETKEDEEPKAEESEEKEEEVVEADNEELSEEEKEPLNGNVEIHKENEEWENKAIEEENNEEEIADDDDTSNNEEEVVEDEEEIPVTEEEIEETVKSIEEDIENKEESEEKPADENSEIPAESDCEDSENDVETTSDEEAVDETSNEEIVENSKSIKAEFKWIEKAEFQSFVKSFNDKLSEKDAEIKWLKQQLSNHQELVKWIIEVMIQLDHAVKNTAIQSWSSYQAPATKNTWYWKVAELLKKMQHN